MVQTEKFQWFHDLSGIGPGWMEQVLCKAGAIHDLDGGEGG
jgi:hypothetical protein